MTGIVLASGSRVRASLLTNAGIAFETIPADLDEDEVKRGFAGPPDGLARELASRKAQAVSESHPDDLVIGADQVLACEGRAFDKPKSIDEARRNLQFFRAKTHTLHSGIALFRAGDPLWTETVDAHLTMRDFSDTFLDRYLDEAGKAILSSVGAYQLESLGVQLFERIEGDYFTILGLPLLALMGRLRDLGALEA